jgi:callose synthase
LKDEGSQKTLFANINLDSLKDVELREKVFQSAVLLLKIFFSFAMNSVLYSDIVCSQCNRLQLLLTTQESITHVPINLEARRRITYFVNSLFMKMPGAPPVRSMMSFR